jgi:hypothetical protein
MWGRLGLSPFNRHPRSGAYSKQDVYPLRSVRPGGVVGDRGDTEAVTGRRVAVLALAAFVVASDATLVAALLRQIAGTLSISAGAGGQAVTVYAAGYAFTAPLISRAAWRAPERRLIPGALGLFRCREYGEGGRAVTGGAAGAERWGVPRRAPRSGFRLARSLAVRSAGGPSFQHRCRYGADGRRDCGRCSTPGEQSTAGAGDPLAGQHAAHAGDHAALPLAASPSLPTSA